MKITAITKFKHGTLWAALKQLNWSQSELAKQCETYPTVIGRVINLQARPSKKLANKIQRVLGENGIYFDPIQEWPEVFRGQPKRLTIEQTREVTTPELNDAETYYNQLSPPEARRRTDLYDLSNALSVLDKEDRELIDVYFGLTNNRPCTLGEIGNVIHRTPERVRQKIKSTLQKLNEEMNK